MILTIKYKVDWGLICHQNQMEINKHNICKNSKIVDHDYKVGYKVMLNNNYEYKHEIQYNETFVITNCCNNGMFTLQCGEMIIRNNIRWIKPYTSDTNVEDINIENIYNGSKHIITSYNSCIIFNLGNKVYNCIRMETLM